MLKSKQMLGISDVLDEMLSLTLRLGSVPKYKFVVHYLYNIYHLTKLDQVKLKKIKSNRII